MCSSAEIIYIVHTTSSLYNNIQVGIYVSDPRVCLVKSDTIYSLADMLNSTISPLLWGVLSDAAINARNALKFALAF